MSSLRPSAREIARHWEEHRPKMSAALKASGDFERLVEAADERRWAVFESAVVNGLAPNQAEELAQEEWLLPSEEDEESPEE